MLSTDIAIILVVTILFGLFVAGISIFSALLLSRETSKIPEVLSRLIGLEITLNQLAADVGAEIEQSGQEMWRSADGKYNGRSFEELLQNMSSDPNGPLTDEEIESIKSVFKKIQQSDDDDEPKDPWKK